MKRRITLTSSVCIEFYRSQQMMRMSLPFWSREGIFHIEVSSSVFRNKREDQSSLLVSVVSQLTLTQNNQSAKGAHFGITYFELLQCLC